MTVASIGSAGNIGNGIIEIRGGIGEKHSFCADPDGMITLPLRRGCYDDIGGFARYNTGACIFQAGSLEGLQRLVDFLHQRDPVQIFEWYQSSNGGFLDSRELPAETAMEKLSVSSWEEVERVPRGSWHPLQKRRDEDWYGKISIFGGIESLSANTVAQFRNLPDPRSGKLDSPAIGALFGSPSGRRGGAEWWRIGPGGGSDWRDRGEEKVLPFIEAADLRLEKVILNYKNA